MAFDTLIVIAAQYDSEADALADYDEVAKIYKGTDLIDTYDAAVLTRKADGKVDIVKRHEEPVKQGAGGGLVLGLAVGAGLALFPAIGIAGALIGGGALGAGAGAVAGHVAMGMSRSDLKELGETLDEGQSGLIVVAASDMEAKINQAVTRAKKQAKAQLQADTDKLKKEIDAL